MKILLLSLALVGCTHPNQVPVSQIFTAPIIADGVMTELDDCVLSNEVHPEGMYYYTVGADGIVGTSTVSCDAAYANWMADKKNFDSRLRRI